MDEKNVENNEEDGKSNELKIHTKKIYIIITIFIQIMIISMKIIICNKNQFI